MNIFYNVQVSNTTKKEDGSFKWVITSDACMNMAIGIIECILEKRTDWHFYLKVPPIGDVEDLGVDGYKGLFKEEYHENIHFFYIKAPISPVDSRFHFDFVKMKNCKQFFKHINVMINDENTLTKNYRVLYEMLGLKIPIVSTNYFLDSPLHPKVPAHLRYYERQMESLHCSDLTAFVCEAGKKEFIEGYDYGFNYVNLSGEGFKTTIWQVGVHAKEILEFKNEDERYSSDNILTVYFGNRITDTAGRYTNWHIFAEAIGNLTEMSKLPKWQAVMLNPTRKATKEQLEEIRVLSKGKIKVISNSVVHTRKEYLEFINKAHVSCNLFTHEVYGGITHAEAMVAGNIVVMPKLNNYVKPGLEEYPFYVEPIDDYLNIRPDDIAEKIHDALKLEELRRGWSEKLRTIGAECESYESASSKIIEDLETLVTK